MAFSIPHFTNCRISSIIPSKASPTQLRTSRWTMRKWPISTRISRGTCKAYLVSQRFLMLMDSKPPGTWHGYCCLLKAYCWNKWSWWGAKLAFTELGGMLIWKEHQTDSHSMRHPKQLSDEFSKNSGCGPHDAFSTEVVPFHLDR